MISKEEMKNIANLSKLYLDEEEIERGIKDMNSIVEFVNQIIAIDYAIETKAKIESVINAFREDDIKTSFSREKILNNVNGGKDGFFFLEKSK